MPRYRKLPPISRTPTPPPDFLRRSRPFSCNPFEPVDEDGQDRDDCDDEDMIVTPTSSADHSFPLIKGAREPKKQYLSVGKGPAGRSKRQRLEKQPQVEETSPDIVLENESVSEWDILGSIFVAGGILMMGDGFGEKGSGGDEVGERGGENLAVAGAERVMNDIPSTVTGSDGEGNFRRTGGGRVDSLQSIEVQTTAERPQSPDAQYTHNINPIVKGRLHHTDTPFELEGSSEVLDVDTCDAGELIFGGTDNNDGGDTGPNNPNPTAPTTKPIEDGQDFGDTRKHAQPTAPLSPDDKGKSTEKITSPITAETAVNNSAIPPVAKSVIPSTNLDSGGPRELLGGDPELKKKAEGDEWYEVDILLKAVMDVYDSPEEQSIPQSVQSLTLTVDGSEGGDTVNRGIAPVVLANTAPPPAFNGTEGGLNDRGSRSPAAKPMPEGTPAGLPPNCSPAPVVDESRAEIRTDKGAEPVTTTTPQPSPKKDSEGGGITEKKSLIVKLKSKGIAVLLPSITDSDATNQLCDTSSQASDQTPDHCSNHSKPKPVWPVPPPPLSASPPAAKIPPTPRPPTYRKPDPPAPKLIENAKATANGKPRTPEQAISTTTLSPKAGSFSKKLSPELSGSLVASSDASAAARKKVEQEKVLKNKAKNTPRNVFHTPMLPPRYQGTRSQSLQSQSLETSSTQLPSRPLTPATSVQTAVHKLGSHSRPPSSNTGITGAVGITKSSLRRKGVPPPPATPGPPDTPAQSPSAPALLPISTAITPSMDDSRWIQENPKGATVNTVTSLPFHKASKPATEEPCSKFTPLVSKSNFLYFEPSAVKKSPSGPHEKPTTQDLAPLSDSPSTIPPDTKPKPERMVFAVTRYNNNATTPSHCAEFYGHEILSTGEPNKFSWEKLREILESRHKFVDFKECLVINLFHVVEGEKELNEGLNIGVYLNINEVLIVKVDPLGRLPPPLVAEMKAARLAARKAGGEAE